MEPKRHAKKKKRTQARREEYDVKCEYEYLLKGTVYVYMRRFGFDVGCRFVVCGCCRELAPIAELVVMHVIREIDCMHRERGSRSKVQPLRYSKHLSHVESFGNAEQSCSEPCHESEPAAFCSSCLGYLRLRSHALLFLVHIGNMGR